MVGASVKIFLPGPVIFKWHQLIQIGTTINHRFLVYSHPLEAFRYRFGFCLRGGWLWYFLHWGDDGFWHGLYRLFYHLYFRLRHYEGFRL